MPTALMQQIAVQLLKRMWNLDVARELTKTDAEEGTRYMTAVSLFHRPAPVTFVVFSAIHC